MDKVNYYIIEVVDGKIKNIQEQSVEYVNKIPYLCISANDNAKKQKDRRLGLIIITIHHLKYF